MEEKNKKIHLAILGSTGSIGTQALEVISAHPDRFQVEILSAHSNADLLIEQALAFQPNAVVISDDSKYTQVVEALASQPIKVFAGQAALEEVVRWESVDTVVAAIVGFAGLK